MRSILRRLALILLLMKRKLEHFGQVHGAAPSGLRNLLATRKAVGDDQCLARGGADSRQQNAAPAAMETA